VNRSTAKPPGPGRPRRADEPRVDYEALDRLLVGGEEVLGRDGERLQRFPSFREVARRLGVAHSLITKYAREHNCVERRANPTAVRPGRPKREAPPVVIPKAPRRKKDSESTALTAPPQQHPARTPGEPVDTSQMDRWLVHGETVPIRGASAEAVIYPSISEIARRLGVTRAEVVAYGREHDCERRRAEAEARVRARVDQKLIESRAERIAVTRERKIEIVDHYIEAFYEALKDGRVRVDSIQDFNAMVRLRSFLEGGADQRSELLGGLSLDDLRTSHAEFLRDRSADTAAMVGVSEAELVVEEGPMAGPTKLSS
jgi:transposase-like protein